MPRLALVSNDRSGALIGAETEAGALPRRLRQAGFDAFELTTGALPDRMAAAVASGADALVVTGGDGTVACACQHLAGREMTLGIMPAGTMNLLARDLTLPVDDPAAAAAVLTGGHTRRIDVGMVGSHVFACACMLGAPTRIGHHRELARAKGNGVLGWLRVARAARRILLRQPPLRLTLVVDGQATRLRTVSLTITVNALDDESGRAFGRTRLDGGMLCAYALRPRGAWDMLRLAWRFATGSSRDPALARFAGTRIEVRADTGALRIMIDGEAQLLPPPLVFTVRPGALRVFVPAP